MSPEQIRGNAVDARSDLFSLAVVLYEALTSKRPFAGDDLPSVAYSVVHTTPVPVSEEVRGLPRELDSFFDRALAKDPKRRFADSAAFRTSLREAGSSLAAPKRARAPRSGTTTAGETIMEPGHEMTKATMKAVPPGQEGSGLHAARPDATEGGSTGAQGSEIRGRRGRRTRFGLAVAILPFLITLVGVPILYAKRSAHLKLEANSSVAAGDLTLLLDGRPIYARRLAAPHGSRGLARLLGKNHEEFEAWMKIPPGKHELSAEVTRDGQAEALKDAIVLDLGPGETRTLNLTAGASFGRPVQIKVD